MEILNRKSGGEKERKMTEKEIEEYHNRRGEKKCHNCNKYEHVSLFEYSQGEEVCPECKKKNTEADNLAYDRWATRAR